MRSGTSKNMGTFDVATENTAALPTRKGPPVFSPSRGGDYDVLRKSVDEQRSLVRNARSSLASYLHRLGEHHVRNKEYDDAMDAFTEALHEKRSVYSQLIPSLTGNNGATRTRTFSSDTNSVFDGDSMSPDVKAIHDQTVDDIVQTLKNMGNVHSLRGEQDEAMRYYTEVTNLRASRSKKRDDASVCSKTKSTLSGFWGDEDTSTLMSEINEDVKALDDLFRSISFRNGDSGSSGKEKRIERPKSPISEKSKKRRRADGLRENGSSENEPFRRSTSSNSVSVSNNELIEALEIYRSVINTLDDDNRDQHDEKLNSYTLRADLLHENFKRSDTADLGSKVPEGHPSRVAELQLAMEVYRQVLVAQREMSTSPIQDSDCEPQLSANMASSLIRMGSLCYKLNNVEEELQMYEEAKAVYKKAFGDNHTFVAGTRKNIGMVLAERGDYDGAMTEFKKARQIYLAASNGSEMDRNVASAISCMGNVKNRMGDLDDALDHYVQALRIYQTVAERDQTDESTRDVTATIKIIGMVHAKKGDLDTAMQFFSEAMGILRTSGILDTNNGKETMASVLSRIASIHFKKGEYEQAMLHYREAHDLTVHLRGLSHPEVAGILHYIGGIHHKMGEYEDAMNCYQEAVRVYHSTLGPGHPAVAATLVCIGSIHYKRRNLDSAMMFYREALRLNRDAYGLHHPDVAPTLKSIGTILTKKGEYDEAYDVFRDVLSIKCTVHGTGHPEVANAYKSLGNVHYKRGELADAERQYRHALTIYRRTKGDSHADTLSAQTSIQHIRYWMKERGNRDRRESRNPPPEGHAEC
jgi:tetratricopeptide (TPR) repeat protein